jgi:hypothetical protein
VSDPKFAKIILSKKAHQMGLSSLKVADYATIDAFDFSG